MLRIPRQTSGSTICPSCGSLVGINDGQCFTCGRRNPGMWGFAPALRRMGSDLGFVPMVVVGCTVLYLLSLWMSGPDIRMGGALTMFAPSFQSLYILGASGALPVFGSGRWWTVVSAAWLHAGVLHVLFNMLWVRQLGPATAETYGPSRLVLIYTAGSIAGFTASSLGGLFFSGLPMPFAGAQFTVGASAPIFGLLGALVHYGTKTGSSMARQQALQYALILGLFGLIMPGVDNYAHAGGFVGGWLAGRVLNPLEPERISHAVAALACLAATLTAIVASIVAS